MAPFSRFVPFVKPGTLILLALIGVVVSIDARENAPASYVEKKTQNTVERSGTLGRKSLYDALIETGSNAEEATVMSQSLGRSLNMRRLDPEDRYSVIRSTSGKLFHLTLLHGLARYVATPTSSGRPRTASYPIAIATESRHASGIVHDSLWISMESVSVPPDVIFHFADAFQWTVDFLTEPRNGDQFAVMWTERKTPEGRILGRRVEALTYRGSITGKRTGILFEEDYYDEEGDSLQRMFLRAPLRFSRISSRFTQNRYHPILRINRPHHGTDYAAPRGTSVSSVADGVVVEAQREHGFGNVVKIRHGAVYTTLYGHLSRFGKGIRQGIAVKQGRVIGYVGSTGLANGPHLHFQIEKYNQWVDFLKLDLPFAHSVPSRVRDAFSAKRKQVLAQLEDTMASAQASR